MKAGRYKTTEEMVRDVSEDPAQGEAAARALEGRAITDLLMAERTVRGLSQKDIAAKMGCSQSRVSKLEAGTDADLRVGELEAYAAAVDLGVSVQLGDKGATIADQVKAHVLAARRLLHRIAELSKGDAAMTGQAQSFFAEVLFNAALSVGEAVRNLEVARKSGLLDRLPAEPPPPAVRLGEADDPPAAPPRSTRSRQPA